MSEPLRLPVGVHDILERDYHADPAIEASLSSSVSKLFWEACPLKVWLGHPRLNPKYVPEDPSKRMVFGSLSHKLLLGKGAEIDVCTKTDWRTDFAKDFKKDSLAQGHIPCLEETHAEATALREGALREFKRLGVLEDFEKALKEPVFIFRQSERYLRSMIDAVLIDETTCTVNIFDIKITGDASMDAVDRRIGDENYDIQRAFQISAVQALYPYLGGRIKHCFLFIEDSYPYLCTPVEFSGEGDHLGRAKMTYCVQQWVKCMTENRWPGYSAGIVTWTPKPWHTKKAEERLGLV